MAHTLDLKAAEHSVGSQGVLGLLMGCLLAAIVWLSTVSVGRISTILVIGMVISFIISVSGTFSHVNPSLLFQAAPAGSTYPPYLWAALPYFITSFGFSSMVPSLYKYYGLDIPKIKGSLFYGSILALVTYLAWISICFGVIARPEFIPINAAGGNMCLLYTSPSPRD